MQDRIYRGPRASYVGPYIGALYIDAPYIEGFLYIYRALYMYRGPPINRGPISVCKQDWLPTSVAILAQVV